MSSSGETSGLEAKLLTLECRFTWRLDIEDLKKGKLAQRLQNSTDERLEQKGRLIHSYNSLAYIRYLQGEPLEALSLLQKSVELTEDHYGNESDRHLIVSYGDMAWLYFKIGDYAQSNTYYDKLDAIKRKYPSISPTELHPEVYGEKGWTFLTFFSNANEEALEYFHKAVQQQPNDKGWNLGYAIVLYHTEVDSQVSSAEESLAIQQVRRAIETNPEDGLLMVLLALKLAFHRKHKEAYDLVEKALDINPVCPRVWKYLLLFFQRQFQGQTDNCIGLLRRALQKHSQSSYIHYQLALCYNNKKISLCSRNFHGKGVQIRELRQESIYHLEEAIKIWDTYMYAIGELALLYAEEKDLDRAKELLDKALEMTIEKENKLQFVHCYYGLFHYYHTKQEDQAVSHFTKGLMLYRNTYCWKRCARQLKIIAERRLKVNTEDAKAYGLLGLVYRQEGDTAMAVECYEKALESDTENQEYLSALFDLRTDLR